MGPGGPLKEAVAQLEVHHCGGLAPKDELQSGNSKGNGDLFPLGWRLPVHLEDKKALMLVFLQEACESFTPGFTEPAAQVMNVPLGVSIPGSTFTHGPRPHQHRCFSSPSGERQTPWE